MISSLIASQMMEMLSSPVANPRQNGPSVKLASASYSTNTSFWNSIVGIFKRLTKQTILSDFHGILRNINPQANCSTVEHTFYMDQTVSESQPYWTSSLGKKNYNMVSLEYTEKLHTVLNKLSFGLI
jgi:hypothetical protein